MVTIKRNGYFPAGSLATTYLYYPGTTNGRQIRKDIAPYAEAMATAFYRKFGKPLLATDGARDYATQVRLKAQKGVFAATPGTSNHGWAKAFDLASGVQTFGTPEHEWMRKNAHRWGFMHPTWAHDGNPANGQQEAWHWEFVGGGTSTPRVQRTRFPWRYSLGAKGPQVRTIQEQLRNAGQKLVVDGDYGLGTAVNVLVFQEKHGLKRHGKADAATRRALAKYTKGK